MDAIDRARELIPWWAGLGAVTVTALVAFIASYLCAAGIARFGRRALRKVDGAHWTERSRAAFYYRYSLGSLFGLVIIAVWLPFKRGPLAPHVVQTAVTSAIAVYGALAIVRVRFERHCGRTHLTLRGWLRSTAGTWLLMWPHALVALVVAAATPASGWRTLVTLATGYALMVVAVYGGGLRVATWVGLVRDASERVGRIAHETAARLDATLVGVHEVRHVDANAFALPHAGRLVYTDRAVALLDDAQLAALTAHEIGHLKESTRVRFTRLTGLLILFPLAAIRPLLAHGGLAAVGFAVLGAVGISLVLRGLGRRMEVEADAVAIADESEPGAYARALEALYRDNLTPAVMPGKRQVHPHLYDRLESAGAVPDYDRPAPPKGPVVRWLFVVAILLVGMTLGLGPFLVPLVSDSEGSRWLALALRGKSRTELGALAHLRGGEDAVTLYAAAEEIYPYVAYWPAARAETLLDLGRPEEAEVALREAERRADKYDLDTSYIEKVSARLARRGP